MTTHHKLAASRSGELEWQITNGLLRATVCSTQGADITGLRDLRSEQEVLWRNPDTAGTPGYASSGDGAVGFYDRYPGGIQELFPNAGPECEIEGAPLPFHGESCRIPWQVEAFKASEYVELQCRTRLRRYPFTLTRRIRLFDDEPVLHIESTATNTSGRPLPTHWGFHPAFSAAVVAEPAHLLGGFRAATADPATFGSAQAYPPGSVVALGRERGVDRLALVDGSAESADLLHVDCAEGWYVLHSESSEMMVGLTWPVELLPHLWVWQECRDRAGYPWWGRHHIVGVEPHTATPSQTLSDDVAAGAALWVEPGQTVRAEFAIHVGHVGDYDVDTFVQSVSTASDISPFEGTQE